ncbi:hypothetical protein V7O62_02055 [Methanolobus sp. ZRKC2]|uniref:hypothetical protein n=1 Tax=Methanolobus sp. ZRKC2 TaxID=3125783 RepID=UPI003246A82E
MNSNRSWICMDCGKVVFFPSADKENNVVCIFCGKLNLQEMPQEKMVIECDNHLPSGVIPLIALIQNYHYKKANKAIERGDFIDMNDLINTSLAYFLLLVA